MSIKAVFFKAIYCIMLAYKKWANNAKGSVMVGYLTESYVSGSFVSFR